MEIVGLSIMLTLGIVALLISTKERAFFAFLASFVYTVAIGCVLVSRVIAAVHDNRHEMTYSFPAETYSLKVVVTSTENLEIENGDTTFTRKYDTTYVLKGLTPIVGDDGVKTVDISVSYPDVQDK